MAGTSGHSEQSILPGSGTERATPIVRGARDSRLDSRAAGRPPGPKPPRTPRSRFRLSATTRYALRRLSLVPAQLLFVLAVLYTALTVPVSVAAGSPLTFFGFLQGFGQTVLNDVTGNWGQANFLRVQLPWLQVYLYYVPASIQIALFALPIATAIAYPVSLLAGWSRRSGLDAPTQFMTLTGALVPVFVVGVLVVNAVFFNYLGWLDDVPNQGIIPSTSWWLNRGGYPSWVLYFSVTRPTGLPLVDAVLHHAWDVAFISLTKTLLQASVVAVAYVAIFFRHARAVVRTAREEPYIIGARSRGVSERTLLWRHAARRVTPSFLLIFALTLPEYLGVQFAVEAAFADQSGFGFLIFSDLTRGVLSDLGPLIFVLAVFVLVWTYAIDLLAVRLDPRGVVNR